MGYIILNYTQELRKKYVPRDGLEGPFFYPNGRVLYYSPTDGEYWDPQTDFFVPNDEVEILRNMFFEIMKR